MLDWSFNKFEALPLLVSLLLDAEKSRNENILDDLYNTDEKQLMSELMQCKETCDFIDAVIKEISGNGLLTDKKYTNVQFDYHAIHIEPVSFFRWAEKRGYPIPYNVKNNVKERETELRIKNYKNYKISKAEVSELMCEPLWLVCDAILYLHGFVPMEDKGLSYSSRNPNLSIINSDKTINKIHNYLYDANKLNEITIYERSGSKVKPIDFMNWAKSLNKDFINLITPSESLTATTEKPLSEKERQTYQNITGALLGVLLGKSSNGVPYSNFESQQAIIEMIHNLYGDRHGLSKRNLESKFAEAKKILNSNYPDNE